MSKNCKPSIIIPDKYSVVVVQNITERNDISCKLRQNGTIAIVVEEGYAQYQIQTQEGFYGVCDNNAWVQIETGDKVFDGNNLIIINDEEQKQEYLQSPLAVVGQMIFFVPEHKYYKYDGVNFVDPFPNKLGKPLDLTINPDNKLIPVYGQSGDNPEWLSSNTLGKVESVNNVGVSPGTKNIELNLSNIPDDVGYATDAELTQLSRELDIRITQVEGINYTWNPTNRTLTLFDTSGRQMSQVSLVSLDNEGTDFRYNPASKSLELYNADNQLLDSIPISDFVGNVGTALQLNSDVLQLKDSQGNVLSSVSFSISNISGLQAALDAKESILLPGTTAQYYRGDKTWQVLNKSAVGLSNVDNTSDINKPVSTAQAAALDTKLDKTTTTVAAPDTTFKYVYLTDESNNVKRMLAGDLGKNVANSSLTSVAGAGLTLGSSWTLDTNGQLYNITNLPDKSTDASFNRMIVQNTSGQVTWSDGRNVLLNASNLLTDAQIDILRVNLLKSTENYSTGQAVISSVNPPIILQNTNYTQYVSLIGSNLFIDPTSTQAQVKIVAPDGTETLVNNFTTAQSNPNILTFPITSGQLQNGDYTFKIFNNGVWSAINNQAKLRVRDAITQLPLPNINWTAHDILGNVAPDYNPENFVIGSIAKSISGNNVTLYARGESRTTGKRKQIFAQSDWAITPDLMVNGVIIKFNIEQNVAPRSLNYSGLTSYTELTSDFTFDFNTILNGGTSNNLKFLPANIVDSYTSSWSSTDLLVLIISNGQLTILYQGQGKVYTQSIDQSKTFYLKIALDALDSDITSRLQLNLNSIYQLD